MNSVLDWMEQELSTANEEDDISKDCTLQLAKLIDNYKKANPNMDICKICYQLSRLERGYPLTPITNNADDWEYIDDKIEYAHKRVPSYWMTKSSPDSDVTVYIDRFNVCDVGSVIEDETKRPSFREPTVEEAGFLECVHPIQFPYFNEYGKGTLYVDCSVPGYEAFLHYKDECTGKIITFHKMMVKFNKDGSVEPVTPSEFFTAYTKAHPMLAEESMKDLNIKKEDK